MRKVELKVRVRNETIRHNSQPKYLGTVPDGSLTFNPHIEKLSQKLKSRNNIWNKLGNVHTLRTTALSLVYSTAEFAAHVWYKSPHVDKIDTQLNETMRIITGTVDLTPISWLHPCLVQQPSWQLEKIKKILHQIALF